MSALRHDELATTAAPRPRQEPPAPQRESMLDRTPPYDPAAEAALLGSIVIAAGENLNAIADAVALLSGVDDFFWEPNQILFRVITNMFDAQIKMDGVTLASTLREKNLLDEIGGLARLDEIFNSVPSSAHIVHYAKIVADRAKLRKLVSDATSILRDVYESGDAASVILDRACARVSINLAAKIREQMTQAEVIQEQMELLDAEQGMFVGIPTGWPELDNIIPGLRKGEFIIVAARPSHGKSAFLQGIVDYNSGMLAKPVGIISLEMTREQVAERVLAAEAGVSLYSLRRRMLRASEREALAAAAARLCQRNVIFDFSTGISTNEIRQRARFMHTKHKIELLCIDYIQLVAGQKAENRTQQVTEISRGIKNLARELQIPIIVAAQLNRANESEKRLPRNSDLRESGSLEQDADIVILLHREEMAHEGDEEWANANPDKIGKALAIVSKQRNGERKAVWLGFNGSATRFESLLGV